MLSPKVVLLRDVLEEHLDELQFLWSLRRDGLRSPTLTRRDLGRLEARIEAHADGLLVARGDLPELVGDALGSDDPLASFAAGFVLLRSGPAGARMVLEAFLAAGEEGREGLSEALSHGSLREVRDDLAACVTSAEGGLAVAAATALAIQRAPRVPSARDTRFLEDPDPRVRLSGWRLLPFLQEPPRAEVFRRGVEDDDPAVSREAVLAAAWFGAPLALETCRERARSDREDSGEWLRLVAVLGDDSDLAFVLSAAGGAGGGRSGPRALGALGHPRGVDLLLETMRDADPARSAAAGEAFHKVTGFDASSDEKSPVRDGGASGDELEEEFLEEVTLPDAEGARAFWSTSKGAFAGGTRWCLGHDVSAGCPGALPADLDMESCREVRLRGRFTGTFKGDATELVRMAPEAE